MTPEPDTAHPLREIFAEKKIAALLIQLCMALIVWLMIR